MATAPAVPQQLNKAVHLADEAWQQAGWLPCRLQADLPLRGFTVGDLLRLEIGAVTDTGVPASADVFVGVNGAPVGCGKLDAVSGRLGVRLTELG